MIARRALIAGLALAPFAPARAAETVAIPALYVSGSGPTDLARSLEGERVRLEGFMAPPLRADARFFVLTVSPSPVCPFCDEESDWPELIMPVHTERRVKVAPFYKQIFAEGVLTLGAYTEPTTGFFSPMRIERARYGLL
jgi:hypothetical protein